MCPERVQDDKERCVADSCCALIGGVLSEGVCGRSQMEGTDDLKAALLLMHPSPYRDAVAKRLREDARFSLDVFYLFEEDFGHSGMGLGEAAEPLAGKTATLYPSGLAALRLMWRLAWLFAVRGTYDFVVWTAYAPWWLTVGVVLRAMLGREYGLSLDTTRGKNCCWLSQVVKRFVFSRAKFLWVPGVASRRFLVQGYGVDDRRIIQGVYSCEFVSSQKAVHGGVVYLMVANDTSFRRMDVIADGFRRFVANGGTEKLVLCGKGVGRYQSEAVECIDGGVAWERLSGLYARADVYVHNGTEQFSVATLMGAMAGLPLLCGSEIGVVADLFGGAEVGMLVEDWESADAWRDAFALMSARKDEWRTMGAEAKRKAAKFDPMAVAKQVGDMMAE